MNRVQDIASALQNSQKIAIAGHISPDGDCLGSALALGLALRQLNKQVTWYVEEIVPAVYRFLPGSAEYQQPTDDTPDVFVLVDCSDLGRVSPGIAAMAQRAPLLVNIDHHISNKGFGQYQLVDSEAAATGEIIFRLIRQLGVQLDLVIATNLYTAILTDTGNFKYENTTATTHLIVAELLGVGVHPTQVARQIYDEMPYPYIQILKVGLNHLQVSDDGKVAWIALSRDDLEKAGAVDEHTDGLINYARLIKGVEVAIMLRETSETTVKVSLRSKNFVDVNLLAAEFGGGGHAKAAGCKLDKPLGEAVQCVVAAAVKAANPGNN